MPATPSGERIVNPDGTITIRITRLRRLILGTNQPQYVTAGECGIAPHILSQYALGRKAISKKHLSILCAKFDCPPEDVLGWETYTLEAPTEDSEVL
jgi:DNA-binding Xre family transcriptional regulator